MSLKTVSNVIPIRPENPPSSEEGVEDLREASHYLEAAQRLFAARGNEKLALRIAAHKHAIAALIIMGGGVP